MSMKSGLYLKPANVCNMLVSILCRHIYAIANGKFQNKFNKGKLAEQKSLYEFSELYTSFYSLSLFHSFGWANK